MKRQNDWYTGIDHYSNYMERDNRSMREWKCIMFCPGKESSW